MTILQRTVVEIRRRARPKKKWTDTIKEWTGIGWDNRDRAADREGWRALTDGTKLNSIPLRFHRQARQARTLQRSQKSFCHRILTKLSTHCDGYEPLIVHVDDSQIKASSSYHDPKHNTSASKLTERNVLAGVYGWLSNTSEYGKSWIEVDLKEDRLIGGIVTLGRSKGVTQYVTKFKIKYRSGESDTFTDYVNAEGNEVFIANTNNYKPVFNHFNAHIKGRYIRLYPLNYQHSPTLRWELFGCTINYSEPIVKLGLKPQVASPDITMSNCIQAINNHIIWNWNGLKTQASTKYMELSGKSLICDMITIAVEVDSTGCNALYEKCEVSEKGENDGCQAVCQLNAQQRSQPFRLILVVDGDEETQLCAANFYLPLWTTGRSIITDLDAFIESIA
ncbi:hypothetical protein CAPTEDRAFT_201367 [Capitella teleta]|uniref:F5/8 type C domain-containing protein n=1 Tax=Capitella teleta TaxID=283909 RepID=R7VEL7_CAPTE|nr:hypothetical protein CAPTEDRAFT_201367 [Capitella teleta]|eukprot:ELU17032.1 hypothetical protein CAPTEDRAFT_201367 [Capitella teleta]